MTPPGEPLADPITELRRLADALLDRLQPWLSSLDTPHEKPGTAHGGTGPDPTPPPSQGPCPCPLCALLTAVRGDRAGLTRRLTTHGLTTLATLRELLLHHTDHPKDPDHHHAAPDPGGDNAPTPSPTEQATPTPFAHRHIPVRRPDGDNRIPG